MFLCSFVDPVSKGRAYQELVIVLVEASDLYSTVEKVRDWDSGRERLVSINTVISHLLFPVASASLLTSFQLKTTLSAQILLFNFYSSSVFNNHLLSFIGSNSKMRKKKRQSRTSVTCGARFIYAKYVSNK